MSFRTSKPSGPPPAPLGPALSARCTVRKVRFNRPDTGWTVALCESVGALPEPLGDGRRDAQSFAAVGPWPGVGQGLQFDVRGSAVSDDRWGLQLSLDATHPPTLVVPNDRDGLVRLLALEGVTHLGPVRAAAVVAAFGDRTIAVLENTPAELATVRGITPERAQQAHEAWMALKGSQVNPATLQALYRYGLTKWEVSRIVAAYGDCAVDVAMRSPYRLTELEGVGFLRADSIALRTGIAEDAPERVRAAVVHVLGELEQEGHCLAPTAHVCALVRQKTVGRQKGLGIGVDEVAVRAAIARLVSEHVLSCADVPGVDEAVARMGTREAEEETAAFMRALIAASEDDDGALPTLPDGLTAEQRAAVMGALTYGVCVVTGGPGTGKTFTLRAVADCLEAAGLSVALAAPTGKAARRMGEATGREAKTVHRLLEYRPGIGFQRCSEYPLSVDAVIVDESSMLDVHIALALLSAIRPGHTRLLLVGDEDQLPSVGAGAVLRDVIASGCVPVRRLTQVQRQKAGSAIVSAAHAINHGERPVLTDARESAGVDLKWMEFEEGGDAAEIAAAIVRLVSSTLARATLPCGRPVDPVRDVQVLCPQRRGTLGVDALNEALAEALNPADPNRKPEVVVGDARRLRLGDRVIQTSNDYRLGVFNGETGIIVDLDPKNGEVAVDFGDAGAPCLVRYGASASRALWRAYALTVHKSQGSEWPVVVIPVHSQHAYMWSRQLLYTGLTRARTWCVLLGTRKAFDGAVRKNAPAERWTALQALLRDAGNDVTNLPAQFGGGVECRG